LQIRLAQENPGEKERIFRRLAGLYRERGAWENAHALYQKIGDLEATVELIEEAGPPLVRRGRLSILGRWLDDLPAAIFSGQPSLLSLRGFVAENLGEVDQGLALLDRAEEICRSAGDRHQLAQVLVWRAIGHRFQANYRASLADADEALTLAQQDADLAQVEAEACRAKGFSLFQMGRLEEAAKWLERSLTAYALLGQAHNVAILLSECAMVCVDTGAYKQALTHANRALDHWRTTKNILWQATIFNNLGYLWHLNGDYEQAGSLLEESLTCARQSGNARFESFALASIGDLYLDLDASDAAQLAYRQSREVAQRIGDGFVLLYLNLAEAALARKQKDLDKAHQLVEAAKELALKSDSEYEQGLYQLEVGQLAMAEGKTSEVMSPLESAAQFFSGGGQRVEGARSYLYLALASQALGDDKATLDYLKRSFNLASELESQHPLVIAGREAKQLLETAQADPTVGDQASLLLQRIDHFEQEIPTLRRRLRRQASVVPFARPKLVIQALGRTQVTLDNKVLTNADWQIKGARDLFFYMLAHPAGITKDAVGATFWPDSSPKQLKLRFKNTLYRLRRALGSNVVTLDEEADRYRFNQALDYEYDVDIFWKKLGRAESEPDPGARRLAYQEAVQLYTGQYLHEVDGIWAWPEREKLQHAYLEALVRLAELFLAAREYRPALNQCRSALKQDPCQEEAHRLAMRAHAALGNRAAVVRQYEACRRNLLAEVKASPSPETERLYRTLIR
jgi:two-component SAPR family response regulator